MHQMIDEIPNDEAKILNYLNKFTTGHPGEMVGFVYGELLGKVLRYIEVNPLQKIEDIKEMFQVLLEDPDMIEALSEDMLCWAYETCLEKYQGKLLDKMTRFRNRGANRALYVNELLFIWYQVVDAQGSPTGKWRWRYEHPLRSFGLLSRVITHLHGAQAEPIAMGILTKHPTDREKPPEVTPDQALQAMVDQGIAVSGERLGWNIRNPHVRTILERTFPTDISMSAYCHSLNAALLPQGFIPEIPVSFTRLQTPDGTDLRTDGSGIYHPEHPALQELIARYGLVGFQIRVLEPKSGLLAKGTMFPSNLANSQTVTTTTITEYWNETTQSWIEESSVIQVTE